MNCEVATSAASKQNQEALWDRFLLRLTANERLVRRLTPWVRAYVRYAPIHWGKVWFWQNVVNSYFAWNSYPFVAKTIFGSRMAGNTRDILQQYVYFFGVWEPHFSHWMVEQLRPGDTFIDVGANIGYYSLLASRLVGQGGHVVAIEASPRIFAALRSNLERNDTKNVRAVNVAVAARAGTIRLFLGPDTNCGLTTVSEAESVKKECQFECEAAALPLNVILSEEEMKNARLIKVDVEGAEWHVIAGIQTLLANGHPDLEMLVEINPQCLATQGKCAEDILRIFQDAGFHAYHLANDYSAESYLESGPKKRPYRLHGPIEYEMDILFSRRDEELL